MKTTIELPDDLYRDAKGHAALLGESLEELIARAVRHEVEKPATAGDRSIEDFWSELKAVAQANSEAWKSKLDAVGAIKEQRRH